MHCERSVIAIANPPVQFRPRLTCRTGQSQRLLQKGGKKVSSDARIGQPAEHVTANATISAGCPLRGNELVTHACRWRNINWRLRDRLGSLIKHPRPTLKHYQSLGA